MYLEIRACIPIATHENLSANLTVVSEDFKLISLKQKYCKSSIKPPILSSPLPVNP